MTSFVIEAIGFDSHQKTGNFSLRQQHGQSHSITVTRRGLLNVASPPRDTAGRFLDFEENLQKSKSGTLAVKRVTHLTC